MNKKEKDSLVEQFEQLKMEGTEESSVSADSCCSDISEEYKDLFHFVMESKEFENGVAECSYLCGKIASLISIGIDPKDALEYFADKENNEAIAKNNIDMAKVNSDANVQCAKLGYVVQQHSEM